jgi:protein-S-isoprenylcysteine O-methyltransferase
MRAGRIAFISILPFSLFDVARAAKRCPRWQVHAVRPAQFRLPCPPPRTPRSGIDMTLLARIALVLLFAWIFVDSLVIGRYRTAANENRDRYSMVLILASNLLAWTAAIWLARRGPGGFVSWPLQAAGLAVMITGIAVRSLAIAQLGRLHSPNVAVQADHRVVDTGLYRHVRHPSYLGALIAYFGCAVALGNWLGVVVVMGLTVPAYLLRIHEEEAVLAEMLGEPYRAYQARTHRLVPGLY